MVSHANPRDFNWHYNVPNWQWEGTVTIPSSPFSTAEIGVQVVGDENPLRCDQIELIERIIGWFPELKTLIVEKLLEYHPDLKDDEVFRTQLSDPAICLFEPEEIPVHSWTFTVYRPEAGLSYLIDFEEREFQSIWSGD